MKIAIVGATGVVGLEMLKQLFLLELNKNSEIILFASASSKDKIIKYNETEFIVRELNEDVDFEYFDIALFSAGASVSQKYAAKFADKNCYVIDNSSAFRMNSDVPLVVPEINFATISKNTKIIANPNCSTIQSVLAIYPLISKFEITEIDYTSYQSVSGSGSKGLIDLLQHKHEFYEKDINDNIIMQIDDFDEDGNTFEELKMINETNKILDTNLEINATCVRVPVSYGHGVSIKVNFTNEIILDNIKQVLINTESIKYIFEASKFKTPKEIRESSKVYVSRIRLSQNKKALLLFSVANNIKKGAATNAVQIAKKIIEEDLICIN